MGFTVYLGTTSKRINSTLQPDYSGWSSYNITLKADTDLDNPVIYLELPADNWPGFNYMYIPSTSAYYWINEIRSLARNRWQFSASMDALATHKTAIMGTGAYIEYGFNDDASGPSMRIRDTRQNVAEAPSVSTVSVEVSRLFGNGVFILSAVGRNGGIVTYKMGRGTMSDLLNTISTDITDEIETLISGAGDSTEGIMQILKYFSAEYLAQGSCTQAIRSCTWLPLDFNQIPDGDLQPVYLGDFNTGSSAQVIPTNTIVTSLASLNIPWPVDDWRRMNCQGLLYLPYVGTVGIPVAQINNETSLTIHMAIEVLSGGFVITVRAGNYYIYTGSGNIGSNYAVGSSNVPAPAFATGAITAVGGAIQAGGGIVSGITGFMIPGMAQSSISNIGEGLADVGKGYLQAITPVIQCAGTMSNNASYGFGNTASLAILYYPPVDDAGFSAIYGHPVFKVATPVAGYCKTRGFSLAAATRTEEIMAINRLMDSGVFIE